MNFYGQNQGNRQVINYLLAAQRNCGTRSVRQNPLVCCNDPVINRPQPPTFNPEPQPQPKPQPFEPEQPEEIPPEVTTQRTTTTTQRTTRKTPQTTQRTTVQPFIPDSSSQLIDEKCQDPNGLEGVCKNIKECPAILNEFISKNKDPAYVQYIQKSNGKCRNIQPNICCPDENRSVQPENPSPSSSTITGRLLTLEEGCGFSNQTHNRVVGGVTAKKG